MRRPLVSIIVPTYNSSVFIRDCIESIKKQTYSNIEIIIVDQTSKDDTPGIAMEMGAKVVNLPKPAFYSPPTKSRNTGANEAAGDILYHLDSDMELKPNSIKEAVEKFEQNDTIVALVAHEEDRTQGFWSKCKALERRCYWGNDQIESARIVRAETFNQVGGYDESINSGEDFDIHRRYKEVGRIGFLETTVIHSLGSLSFKRTINKKYQYGKTAAKYFTKHQQSGAGLLMEQLKSFASHYGLFLAHPVLGIGALFLKGCEFMAGGLGALSTRKPPEIVLTVRKILVAIKTIKNWPSIIVDKFSNNKLILYTSWSGIKIFCRSKSTDINEAIVCLSGHEYPKVLLEVPENSIIFDAGANIGSFLLFFYSLNSNKNFKLHAFEPFDENYNLLKKNLEINKIDNVIANKLAISNKSGKAKLNTNTNFDAAHITEKDTGTEINATTLEDYCSKHRISRIDLLKIDIEGSEYNVVEHSLLFLNEHVDMLLIEYHLDVQSDGDIWIIDALKDRFEYKYIHKNETNGVLFLKNNRVLK